MADPALFAPKAGAEPLLMIDFATRLVQPEQIKAAGYHGALVYVSQLRPGATFDFKPVTREFTDGMRALGLHVVSIYQYGKPGWVNSPSDFTRGYDGGVADAQTALAVARRCRRSVNELGWAIADGVVGASTTPGYRWAWQTRAWSDGKRAPGAVLFQREVVNATDPGAIIDGVSVDVDDVLALTSGSGTCRDDLPGAPGSGCRARPGRGPALRLLRPAADRNRVHMPTPA